MIVVACGEKSFKSVQIYQILTNINFRPFPCLSVFFRCFRCFRCSRVFPLFPCTSVVSVYFRCSKLHFALSVVDDSAVLDELHLHALPLVAIYAEVEVAAADAHVVQAHLGPCLWQTRRHGEAVQACGTNAEKAFGDDAGVEGALGRQVSLVALGPCLNGIRHMAAQQACAGVILQEPQGALGVACHEGAAQGIEGGAVPEGLAARLCQHAVLGPQAR